MKYIQKDPRHISHRDILKQKKLQGVCPGGGTQYKSGYRDVPQTWVAKSGRQVHQWVPFFQKHGTLMGLFFKIF